MSWMSLESDITPIVPEMPSVCQPRCINQGSFIPAVRGPANSYTWRWVWMVLLTPTGSSTAWFQLQIGGTISSSPETTCSSSGRKNRCGSGVRLMDTQCDRWSGWINFGRWPQPGTRHDYKQNLDVPSQMRFARFSPAWAWRVISGTTDRIASDKLWTPDLNRSAFREYINSIRKLSYRHLGYIYLHLRLTGWHQNFPPSQMNQSGG
jgi:hypothetical protein